MRDPGERGDASGHYPLRYAPKPLAVGVCWAGVLAGAGWAVLTDDAAGRVLAIAALLLCAVLAVRATAMRPKLAAGPAGILVGRLGAPTRWRWEAVRRIEVVASSRLGRRVGVLELEVLDPDGTEHLLVFSTLDLGTDPYLVEEDLRSSRYS